MRLYFLIFLFLFLFITQLNFANTEIDSLKTEIQNSEGNKKTENINRLAIKYRKTSLDSSFKYANSALDRSKLQLDIEGMAVSNKTLGLYYRDIDARDSAINHFKESISFYQQLNDLKKEAAVEEELGRLYRKKGVYDSALIFFKLAAKLRLSIEDSAYAARSIYSIGITFYYMTNYDSALVYLFQSLKLKEDLGMDASSINDHTVIGLIYYQTWDTEKSLEHQLTALKLSKENNNKNLVNVLNNIGIVNMDKKEFEKAIEYYSQVVEKTKAEGKSNSTLAGALDNIGLCYTAMENYDKAIDFHLEGLEIRKIIDDKWGIANSSKNTGKSYLEAGNSKMSIKYLEEGLVIAEEIGSVNIISGIYRYLAMAYELDKNYPSAYSNHKQYLLYYDSLNKIKNGELMAETQTKYETEQKEQQIQILGKENEIKELKLGQSRNLNLGLIGMAVLILIIGGLMIRYNKTIAKHKNALLEQKLLRSQMNPHFIFNSLIAIQSFIYENNALTAGNYLSKFADLMRLILENSRQEYVKFEKEKKTLELYLELQALRFDQKFNYSIEVDPNIEMKGLKIPPMLAQPFLENAIEHGIQHKKGKGNIDIKFKLKEDEIIFEVADDGVGRVNAEMINKEKAKYHESLATSITKERLSGFGKSLNKKFNIHITDLFNSDNAADGTKISFNLPYVLA